MHPSRLLLLLLSLPGLLCAANLAQEQRISEQLLGPQLAGTALWLNAGDTRFLAIYETSHAEQRLGGAVLLHEAGDHADAPSLIGPLRQALAARGWDTLSLQLPRPVDPLLAEQRQAAVASARARLQAALALFKDRGTAPLVLVGHGLGAEMALAYLAENPAADIRALVAIGLAAGEGNDTDPVIRAITGWPRPLLDLYGDRDRPAVLATASARRSAAKRSQREGYRQDRVMGADHDFSGLQENLQRRITSWLRRVAREEPAGR
jgi:pimeloyl-ACP methyl ester carboxylesterase